MAARFPQASPTMGDHKVQTFSRLCNLRVIMDNWATVGQQVNQMCCTDYPQLHAINQIKKYCDKKSLITVIQAFVSTKQDFCSSMLASMKQSLLNKTQQV